MNNEIEINNDLPDEQEMEKRGFTEKEAAYYIAMSRAFLSQDRMNGFRKNRTPGPRFVRVGRTIDI